MTDEDFIHNRFGYCFYTFNSGVPVAYNLYVHPEYRRQGKARKLLRHVINEIRETGYKGGIGIESIPRDNSISVEKLIAFYRSMGLKVLDGGKV